MGYSNIIHVQMALAQALTSASPDQPSTGRIDLINIGNELNRNNVTESIVYQYIQWSDNDINADISSMYVTPVKPWGNYETIMYADIDEHNPYIILSKPDLFNVGDDLILTDGTHEELHYIEDITDGTIIETHDPILYYFREEITRIIRIAYPPPLTQCSARIAAANIYDKYFSAQSDPNTSDYGKFLRKQARQDINNILNGTAILHGAHRITRFYNANLSNGLSWPSQQQTSQRREIDDIS